MMNGSVMNSDTNDKPKFTQIHIFYILVRLRREKAGDMNGFFYFLANKLGTYLQMNHLFKSQSHDLHIMKTPYCVSIFTIFKTFLY